MKKLFSVLSLALVLTLGTITAFATDSTVEQPYEEDYFIGSIVWNGEAWEMTMSANGETIVWLFDGGGTVSSDGEIGDWDEVSQIIGGVLGFELVPFLLEETEEEYQSQATSLTAPTPIAIPQPVPTPESPSAPAQQETSTVFWVPNGSVYHTRRDCSSLSRSRNIHSGTRAQSGMPRRCQRC